MGSTSQTSTMATYVQDCFTFLQKKIYGALLPNPKVKNNPKKKPKKTNFEETPLHLAVAGYIGYYFLFIIGYIREWLYGIGPVTGPNQGFQETKSGYAPLYDSFESFYARNVYRRL